MKTDDLETYDLIFDVALKLSLDPNAILRHMGSLLFAVINSWEKDARKMDIQVISSALDFAMEYDLLLNGLTPETEPAS